MSEGMEDEFVATFKPKKKVKMYDFFFYFSTYRGNIFAIC